MFITNILTSFFVILFTFLPLSSNAQTIGKQSIGTNTGYPIPRFASLASNTVNMRTGPSTDYEVTWEFIQEDLPVEIIFEQEEWRKVRTPDGTVGWMHRSVLNGARTAIITEDQVTLYQKSNNESDRKATLMKNVIVFIEMCEKEWCNVSTKGLSGWLLKKSLWGVYEDEIL
jgi:SH3-like domain-containing protein